jgi:hypothetical protein
MGCLSLGKNQHLHTRTCQLHPVIESGRAGATDHWRKELVLIYSNITSVQCIRSTTNINLPFTYDESVRISLRFKKRIIALLVCTVQDIQKSSHHHMLLYTICMRVHIQALVYSLILPTHLTLWYSQERLYNTKYPPSQVFYP